MRAATEGRVLVGSEKEYAARGGMRTATEGECWWDLTRSMLREGG